MSSCHHTSRPCTMLTGSPVRLYTIDFLDDRRIRQGLIHILFQGNDAAAAIGAVRRDQHFRLRVVDAVAQEPPR